MIRILNNQRGTALLVIAGIMIALSVAVDAVLVNFDNNLKTLESYSSRKQAFYVSEGVRALVTVLLEGYLANNADPTKEEIEAFLRASLPPLVPEPYNVPGVDIEADILKVTPSAIITSGPFKGMNGPVTDLRLRFRVTAPSTLFGGSVVEPLEMRLSVGYVSMFQFMAFYDIAQGRIAVGPPMNMQGRLHSNGDMCVGASDGYASFLKMTVGGRLMNNADSRCGSVGNTRARIATDQTFNTFADFTNSNDNGCTNCGGSGMAWESYALARWREQAMDGVHGVQILKLPGAGMGQTQLREAGNFAVLNNNDNLRFIVDPVLAGDSLTVKSYKFAYNADLRIIDGVWFVKDPGAPTQWPGIPIWSDHPGRHFDTTFNRAVGQEDIRDTWADRGRPWPGTPATPRLFSYYEYDINNSTIFDDNVGEGVVSYGNLVNSGAGLTPQKPGHWVNGGRNLCKIVGGVQATLNCGGGGCGLKSVWQPGGFDCSAGTSPNYATSILNATRGGFRNGHIYNISPNGPLPNSRQNRSRILPVNFDVEQFQIALANNNPGELGSYFGAGGFTGAAFNGVVWISSKWPNAWTGFGGGGPAEPPWHGAHADPLQDPISGGSPIQQALPQPLCSDGAMAPPVQSGIAGREFDLPGVESRFRVPDCAIYNAGNSWPNALRIVNGAGMARARLPKGLSITTNLPVYLVGNYNTQSIVTAVNSVPWMPSLVAGDKVAFVSNNWTDARSDWNNGSAGTLRPATSTIFNTALMTEPSDTLTMFIEDWTGRDLTMNGSVVYGYNAVYALHKNSCCSNITYEPPNRNFRFDPHFGLITNQPPGTPAFPISAVAVWTKAK